MVLIRGRMVANTKVTGTMESNTAREFIDSNKGRIAEVVGKKEKESPGWMSFDRILISKKLIF